MTHDCPNCGQPLEAVAMTEHQAARIRRARAERDRVRALARLRLSTAALRTRLDGLGQR